MATISKVRRLTNPGLRARIKRKLSPLQKMFFGSKRQRAAVRNTSIRKSKKAFKKSTKAFYGKRLRRSSFGAQVKASVRKRNVGSIITVWPKGHSNPGRKKYRRRKIRNGAKNRLVIVNPGGRMAKGSGRVISGYGSTVMNRGKRKMATRRKRRSTRRIVNRRRRRNSGTRQGRSWSTYTRRAKRRNPGRRRVVHHRRRRITNRRHYRRNPGMLTGTAGRVLGVVGGVAVTKLLTGFLPAMFSTGFMSYIGIGAIAVIQGKLVAKFANSPVLGNDMMVGGLAYLTAKILNDFFPTIGAYTGMAGMGLIGGNSFYTPQINRAGSMGNFLIPPAISSYVAGAMPVASHGVGTMRRTGRLM
jgi:hypothetical protein